MTRACSPVFHLGVRDTRTPSPLPPSRPQSRRKQTSPLFPPSCSLRLSTSCPPCASCSPSRCATCLKSRRCSVSSASKSSHSRHPPTFPPFRFREVCHDSFSSSTTPPEDDSDLFDVYEGDMLDSMDGINVMNGIQAPSPPAAPQPRTRSGAAISSDCLPDISAVTCVEKPAATPACSTSILPAFSCHAPLLAPCLPSRRGSNAIHAASPPVIALYDRFPPPASRSPVSAPCARARAGR